MCLAIPVKVKKVIGDKAEIDSPTGKRKKVDISLVSDIKPNEYLLVHADLAINKLDKKEAKEIIRLAKKCTHNHE